jgi:hypothetical protein
VIYQSFSVYSSIWLTDWAHSSEINGTMGSTDRNLYLGVYGGLGMVQGMPFHTKEYQALLLCKRLISEPAIRYTVLNFSNVNRAGLSHNWTYN